MAATAPAISGVASMVSSSPEKKAVSPPEWNYGLPAHL
jgi:hypothetical protein